MKWLVGDCVVQKAETPVAAGAPAALIETYFAREQTYSEVSTTFKDAPGILVSLLGLQ
jgi:hypothetical protein